MARTKLIAGNWKMNGLRDSLSELAGMAAVADPLKGRVDVAVCPPFTLLAGAAQALQNSAIALGAQDCHFAEKGAHTGCISPQMLVDLCATYVIVGHSERRADQGEGDALIRAKAEAAAKAGLIPIICVGETEQQRLAGTQDAVVGAQLAGSIPQGLDPTKLVVAYEPVWAIGTGRTPTVEDVAAMHGFIRSQLGQGAEKIRILYGGSVKGDNALALLGAGDVDGALVGGASLTAALFNPIIEAAAQL